MRFNFLAICALLSVSAYARPLDDATATFNRLDTVEMPSVVLAGQTYSANTALNADRFNFSLTDVRIYHDNANRKEGAYMPWQGKGSMSTGGLVDAFIKVNPRLTAFGSASFETSHQNKVAWNSASDYLRVAPYVLADSVGGNTSAQQYKFSGGVGYSLGRFIIGAEAAYRAEISYRRRDPRIKDVVSDLNFKLGATVKFGGWIAGLSGTATIYNQEVDVDFYNPISDIRTYFMTGIGSVYPRFSGGSTSTSAYEGNGFFGSLQLVQNSMKGLKFSVSGGKETLTQRVRDYNNLDLTKSETYQLTTNIVYSLPKVVSFAIDGTWIRRIGSENIFGTAVGNSYPKLSTRQNYVADFAYGKFNLPVELAFGKNVRLNIVPGFAGGYLRQFLREPNRLLEYSYLSPKLDASFILRTSKSLRWNLTLGADRVFANPIATRITGLTDETERGANVITANNIFSSCQTDLNASLRCDFNIAECPVFYVKGQFDSTRFSKIKVNNSYYSVAVGVTF